MNLKINPHIRRLACSLTFEDVDDGGYRRPIGLSQNGAPVVVEYDLGAVGRELSEKRAGAGLWSFAPLLPVWGVDDSYAADVGGTPVVAAPTLSDELGVSILIKNEGGNPTGSFKDRGLAVGVALGAALGAKRFCLPTQGNAGVAAALFSTRLGLEPCHVSMPASYEGGIYHRAAAHFGAEVRFAGSNIAAAGKAMRERLRSELASGSCVELSTFYEPGRLEGKKTMGLELFEQLSEGLPDWIVYPTGGGTGLVGIWKAFEELRALGLISSEQRLPRMVAVQSEHCAPVVKAFERGGQAVAPVSSKGTIADGLDVPSAIMGHGILRILRASEGAAVAVSEASIRTAFQDLAGLGIPAGYEGAATLAGVRALRKNDTIPEGARVLLLNTSGSQIALAKGAS